jgi:mannose-1-phosphate guanylyltransferase
MANNKKIKIDPPGTVVTKPWGYYTILHNTYNEYYADNTVLESVTKLLVIKEGHRISLQTHHSKDEVWTIVKGEDYSIQINDKIFTSVPRSSPLIIPRNTLHRAEAFRGDLQIIEVASGYIVEESDITRFHDDYNRDKKKKK